MKILKNLNNEKDIFAALMAYNYEMGEDIFEYGWYEFNIADFLTWLKDNNLISIDKFNSMLVELDLNEHCCSYEKNGALFYNGDAYEEPYFKTMQLVADYLYDIKETQQIINQISEYDKDLDVDEEDLQEYYKKYDYFKNLSIESIQKIIDENE